ncbi:HAD family hydrolase [Allobranchiibius huperziae]|uniref:HAD superfamily hydrolase (TIGR01509 family) n=1 Tax=Allobranchiibius huperziae TaxID=1874116 RepID=A0A853DE52_9MICO|nr:HAD-IA family hydrolase [Allobranchiibius huperziae]NYJ75722.1 HAD superfamily hydrolase (TIGR01509 family) [Allobranchiibius huperziae]
MSAVLFGSISTIADTSELQRQSFNKAFASHGLNWQWDRDDYLEMLGQNGGRDRIAQYAKERGETVDADAVHKTKSEIFQRDLASSDARPRAEVVQTIRDAKTTGYKVGLVTTTSRQNISALLDALNPDLTSDVFDVIVDATDVEEPKPSGAAYEFALAQLGENAAGCIAIEDNVGGVQAARAAGLTCVAFPNENTAKHDFGAAQRRVEQVRFEELESLIPSR